VPKSGGHPRLDITTDADGNDDDAGISQGEAKGNTQADIDWDTKTLVDEKCWASRQVDRDGKHLKFSARVEFELSGV